MVDSEQLKRKLLGCLIGAALGDAIGAFWEGHRMAAEEEIKRIIYWILPTGCGM